MTNLDNMDVSHNLTSGHVNKYASELVKKYFSGDDRILITGATGWFGKTTLKLLENLNVKILGVVSDSNVRLISNPNVVLAKWNVRQILDFEPTIIFDYSFLTKEKHIPNHRTEFIKINREFIDKSLFLLNVKTVSKYLYASSGAISGAHLSDFDSDSINPYGVLKLEAESKLNVMAKDLGKNLSILRAWSVSGPFFNNSERFLFSSLINGALRGKIVLQSDHLVWRRYSSLADLIALGVGAVHAKPISFVESGGELIEALDLAIKISNTFELDDKCILRLDKRSLRSDEYFSSNESWTYWCQSLGFQPLDLISQIHQVGSYLRKLEKS